MKAVSEKIKLVLVNLWSFKSNTPHFGLISLAAYLRIKLTDLDISIIEGLDLLTRVVQKNPSIVAFTSDTLTFTRTLGLAKKLKEKLKVPFIIGGVHITAMPESFENVFDIAVIGEGEITLLELLNNFIEDRKFTNSKLEMIRGIIFRDGDRIISTGQQEYIKELDNLPYPARDLVPMEEVYLKGQLNLFGVKRLVSIMTSRGCLYNCIFCGSPVQWGKVRFHTAGYVVGEIEFLIKKYRIDGIMFWDDLFIAPKERLKEFVNRIKEKGLDKRLTFFGYARANLVDEEVCGLLQSINVKRLIFGLESGSDRVLRYLKGGSITVSDNERAVKLCRRYGITTSSGFITGTPGETTEELQETFEFIENNPLDNTQVYILTPYPGTKLWETAKNMKMVYPGMDFGKLFVQLPSVTFFEFFKKNKPGIIEGRIFLNSEYKDKAEYSALIFRMLKLAYKRNLIFYAKTLFFDPMLIGRILFYTISNAFHDSKKNSN